MFPSSMGDFLLHYLDFEPVSNEMFMVRAGYVAKLDIVLDFVL